MTAVPAVDRATRSERAKAARREEILAAARRVFASRGFRGTTIADIADEARVALGTIYLYFPSKEAVFAALSERLYTLIAAAIADVPPAASLEETVARRVRNVFTACGQNRDLVRLVVLNTDPDSEVTQGLRRASEERVRPLIADFERGIKAGVIRGGDAAIMTHLVSGLVSIAVYQAFVVSNGEDAEKYVEACAEMITAYLTPPA